MMRSLVARTLLLVGGVVVLLGAAVVFWITAEERSEARDAAREEQRAAESELRTLARDLLGTSQDTTKALVEGAGRRLVRWIEEEPLGLYRDSADPARVDTKAIKAAFTAEVRARAQKACGSTVWGWTPSGASIAWWRSLPKPRRNEQTRPRPTGARGWPRGWRCCSRAWRPCSAWRSWPGWSTLCGACRRA
jgi:hypothetical protein